MLSMLTPVGRISEGMLMRFPVEEESSSTLRITRPRQENTAQASGMLSKTMETEADTLSSVWDTEMEQPLSKTVGRSNT